MGESNLKANQLISNYIKEYGVDDDKSVREMSAARLWATQDPENQAVAEAIWAEIGVDPEELDELKNWFIKK